MVEVSTSVLNVKRDNATRTFYNLETAHTDYFHIDVMDGKFVDNNTYEIMKDYTNTIKQISNIPLDILVKFYAGGIINIGISWLTRSENYTKEELLSYINKLIPDKI